MATLKIVTPVCFRWEGKSRTRMVTLVTEQVRTSEQAKNLMRDFRGENCCQNPGPESATVFQGIYTDVQYF